MIGQTFKKEESCDGSSNDVPPSIEPDDQHNSTLSNITAEAPVTPNRNLNVLLPSNYGMPSTPPNCTVSVPSDEMIEDGYDTDYEIGPFYEEGIIDDLIDDIEEATPDLSEASERTEVAAGSMAQNSAADLDNDTIDKMKVLELGIALQDRGISKHGLKTVLVDRLKDAVAKGVKFLDAIPADEVANRAGDSFTPGAYWKLLNQSEEEVDEGEMMVDGLYVRAPTASEKDDPNNPRRLKKRNYPDTFDCSPFIAPTRLLPKKNVNGDLKKRRWIILLQEAIHRGYGCEY